MKILLLILLFFNYLFSAPALNITREFKQSDGTTFNARAFGDQYLNWIETQNGDILKYNAKNQDFEYAYIEDESLKPSGYRYTKNLKRLKKVKSRIDKEELYKLWNRRRTKVELKLLNY